MNYKIVADSSADLIGFDGADFASVPLKICLEGKEYTDDASLDVAKMLEELKSYKGKSRTSCPSSGEYIEAFGDAENIFCITITSHLSGSYNAAKVAEKMYLEEHPTAKIFVIDSLTTGPEMCLVIEKIAALANAGADFDDICRQVTDYNINHTRLIFALESMHNLANNGRVSPIAAKMAGMLGIRAVGRASEEGVLDMICKSRGAQNMVSDIFTNMKGDGYHGGRVLIHDACNKATAEMLKNKITSEFSDAEIVVADARGLCSFYAEAGGLLIGFEI